MKVPRSSIASSSSSISSSVMEGAGLWTESKESRDSMAAKSFLCCCCCCSLSPLLLVSNLRLEGVKERMVRKSSYSLESNQVHRGFNSSFFLTRRFWTILKSSKSNTIRLLQRMRCLWRQNLEFSTVQWDSSLEKSFSFISFSLKLKSFLCWNCIASPPAQITVE